MDGHVETRVRAVGALQPILCGLGVSNAAWSMSNCGWGVDSARPCTRDERGVTHVVHQVESPKVFGWRFWFLPRRRAVRVVASCLGFGADTAMTAGIDR